MRDLRSFQVGATFQNTFKSQDQLRGATQLPTTQRRMLYRHALPNGCQSGVYTHKYINRVALSDRTGAKILNVLKLFHRKLKE